MKQFLNWVVALAIAGMAVSAASADQWERGPKASSFCFWLVTQKSVQNELKFSEDQTKKAAAFADRMRELHRTMLKLDPAERRKKLAEIAKEMDAFIASTLTAEQTMRFRQIFLQLSPVLALYDPEVVKALKLTEDQQWKVHDIEKNESKEMNEISNIKDLNARREKLRQLRKSTQEKLMAILYDDQKKMLKELTGEPFKGELDFEPSDRGRRDEP